MFRRSNSSSNIPIPKVNLFGVKDTRGRKRSQSISRLSQRDSCASTSQLPRASSLDRKSSNVPGFSRTTPRMGNKASSLQRTTPTSALSQRTRSITPLSCRKEHKTIQKLSSDKKWVAEQYAKVQYFIESSSLFDLNIINVKSLKPPTINTFIYVTSVLLKEISRKINITKENYKEVILAQLKLFNYPGTLSNSVLKTVNTLHSWPQIIGMWSWLIDKVNLGRTFNVDEYTESLDHEDRWKFLFKENCWNLFVKRYCIFNNDQLNEEEIQRANDEYVKTLGEILEIDFDELNQIKEEVLEKRENKAKLEEEINQLKAEQLKMQSDIEELKRDTENFRETDAAEEDELNNELLILQLNIKDLKDAKGVVKENVEELEEAIKTQPCTYQEKQHLLQQISELKDEIQVKKGKIERAQKIKNKFDRELASEYAKIQKLVIEWNRSLMEVSIINPELRKLLLREKMFDDPEFLVEVQEVLERKDVIENNISEALRKIENNLRIQGDIKDKFEMEIEKYTKTICHHQQDLLKISETISSITKEINDVGINDGLRRKKEIHAERIRESQENNKLEEQAQKIAELKAEKERLDTEVMKFAQKMLGFFIEMHNQVVNKLKELDVVRRNSLKKLVNRAMNTLEQQNQLIETLNSFSDDIP
ncbi:hypothetical protein NQ317_003990 [Molorchus minor]|uniref:Kinetochore protein NDC80 n=1 Tax=Molorchus minor TaxID=1323400 RepID=A0ABQ9K336_9CUCU|nr:hypothetical protein NQ317_003990 [Molorchus minor]